MSDAENKKKKKKIYIYIKTSLSAADCRPYVIQSATAGNFLWSDIWQPVICSLKNKFSGE